jgi:hypothetical protein
MLALGELCRIYRSPVIACVRSRGCTDEAEDFGQAFFARFIESAPRDRRFGPAPDIDAWGRQATWS